MEQSVERWWQEVIILITSYSEVSFLKLHFPVIRFYYAFVEGSKSSHQQITAQCVNVYP